MNECGAEVLFENFSVCSCGLNWESEELEICALFLDQEHHLSRLPLIVSYILELVCSVLTRTSTPRSVLNGAI